MSNWKDHEPYIGCCEKTEKYKPKVGDTVNVRRKNVTITEVHRDTVHYRDAEGHGYYTYPAWGDHEIELVKPAVVTFGPGDTVRLTDTRYTYHIGVGGYLRDGIWRADPTGYAFTSEYYEKVDI